MAFYENTIVAKQDLAEKELETIKEKYNQIINASSGKVLKIEEWGLLNLAKKIRNYKKGFYIHYKFEGNRNTLNEVEKMIKVDGTIIRHLTVKYKKLDTKNEFFKKDVNNNEKKK
jgi:small subunit ribosomal protein S6